ncbi:MAG: BspA family leucine-rich repeat surface protein [Oscillospiraceae bacterium]|nr:BspA family leucine-rich repeat surface protein [Oscillospiraceae bacterium]
MKPKSYKKSIIIILTIISLLAVGGLCLALFANPPTPIASGTVGRPQDTGNAPWTLYSDGRVVVGGGTLRGTFDGGVLSPFSPWHEHRDSITKIVFTQPVNASPEMGALFRGLVNMTEIEGLDYINMTPALRLNYMFRDCGVSSLDLSAWDMSNVEQVRMMFRNATNLVEVQGLQTWDTSNFMDMRYMFRGAAAFNGLDDISSWNVENSQNIRYMFAEMANLTHIDLNSWDTGNVTDMQSLFRDTPALVSVNISNWNTGNVRYMQNMFRNAPVLTSLDLSEWDVSNVTRMDNMFNDAAALSAVNASTWNVGNVTRMDNMFRSSGITALDLSGWNTGSVTRIEEMFRDMTALTMLDVSNFDLSGVNHSNGTMGLFRNTPNLTALDVSNWNMSGIVNTNGMFRSSGILHLDLSSWNVSSVGDMFRMFSDMTEIQTINLEGWIISPNTIMGSLFLNTSNLQQITLGSGWQSLGGLALPYLPTELPYSGRWTNVGAGSLADPQGNHALYSAQLLGSAGNNLPDSGIADTWIRQLATFGIDLSGDHTFPGAYHGYPALTPHNAIITNTGNVASGELNITLGGANPTAFTVNVNTVPPMYADETFTFTIVPNVGLPAGTHTAVVTVSGENGISESFAVSFSVNVAPAFSIGLSGDRTFPAALVGYDAQTPHTATITNMGNRPTGALSVTLGGANPTAFTVSINNVPSMDAGDVVTFTIVPNVGLPIGTHVATVTVTGENGISESFVVSFSVNLEPTPNHATIIFDLAGGNIAGNTESITHQLPYGTIGASNVPSNPDREGYAFLGWRDSTTNQLLTGEQIGLIVIEAENTRTFTAEWNAVDSAPPDEPTPQAGEAPWLPLGICVLLLCAIGITIILKRKGGGL